VTTIYGIRSCDSCRKAMTALPDAAFRDIRAEPLRAEELAEFLTAFGEKLLNRASTTWRGLDDAARNQPPATLLAAHPAVMKRPVIRADDGALHIGWTPATRASLGIN
jgi:arsenate reductase (glutaredoxin)